MLGFGSQNARRVKNSLGIRSSTHTGRIGASNFVKRHGDFRLVEFSTSFLSHVSVGPLSSCQKWFGRVFWPKIIELSGKMVAALVAATYEILLTW